MKKRLKGLLALIMVMAMIVSISPYTFGAIGDGVWGSAPDSEKFMKVVIDAEMTLEERLEEAYESTGWYLLQTYEVDVDDNASIGTSMDNYSEYAPDHYRIDGWKIWECYYSGELCLDDELKTTLVGADYIVTEEDIKQYGQTDGWFLYQPYIEAKFAPIDYVFPVYDVTGTQILEDLSFNIKNYKDKTLDIPEGYAGYMMTIQVENINGVFQYESFVHSYETMFNELDYYVKGYGASEISIAKIVPTKKMPYYVEDIEKIENLKILGSKKTIWLEPGESLVDNEELMTYYPHHMPEGEWEVWFVNSSGYLYEYKDEEVGVTITDAFTAEEYSEFMNYPKKYYNSTYPILREKLTPRIYEIPVYDMKGIKTEETFDINIDNYKKWDDNIGEDSTTTLTYDFNNHLTTEGDSWIFEYGDTSVTVENPTQIGNILFAEKTTCDMSKAKLKAVCNEHKYDKGVVVNDSTLSQLGTTKYTCERCGHTYNADDIPKKIAVRTITLDKTSYVYTGSAIKPIIRVEADNTELKEGTDYTVTFSENVNVGKAKITVKGIGKYAGTVTTTFDIEPKNIEVCSIVVDKTNYVYTGDAIKPAITVKDDNTELKDSTDYTVTYSNNINTGKAEITVAGIGNYSGAVTRTFDIDPKSIAVCTITLDKTNHVYTGDAIQPVITVKDNDTELKIGTDYTVTYLDNVNVGKAKITVEGIGNYSGTVTTTFNIEPKNIGDCSITLDKTNHVYTGDAIQPAITVKDNDTELKAGTDYTVTYSENINVGKSKITVVGEGNYTGTATTTFSIEPKNIEGCNIALDKTNYIYTGDAIQSVLTVKVGDTELKAGADYTVTYSENVNVGKAKITVVGKGNYTGTATTTFSIEPKNIEGCNITLDKTNYIYTGDAIQSVLTVKVDNTELKAGADYTVTYSENINVGKAKITVVGKGNYTGTATTTFSIEPKNIEGCNITLDKTNYVYTGDAIQSVITVKLGDTELKAGADYTVTYSENINVGKAKITVVGKGNYTGTATTTFSIEPKNIEGCNITLDKTNYVYTGDAIQPVITVKVDGIELKVGTDYSVSCINNVNTGEAKLTVAGKGNYTGTVTTSFNIDPKNIAVCSIALDKTNYVYTGSAIKPTITVKAGNTVLKEGTDYTVSCTKNVNVGQAQLTVKGKGNYTGTVTTTFNVIPKEITTCIAKLDKTSYTYTGKAIKPTITVKAGNTVLKLGTDYTVSYTNNVNTGKAKLTVKGKGNYSGSITRTFNIVPKKVSGFKQTGYELNNVPLKWDAAKGADGYIVVRKDVKTGKLEYVGTTKKTTYKVTGLKSGSTYKYGVRPYIEVDGTKIYGEVSVIRTTITKTYAPKISVSPWTQRATVFIGEVRGVDGYEIYMSTSKYGKYTKIASLQKNASQYRKTDLLSKKTYYFKVRSYKINAGGAKVYSAYSSIVSGKTR